MTEMPQPNQDMLDKTAENIRRGEYQTAKEIIATMTDDPKTSDSLVPKLRAELERWQETFAEGFFLASNPEDARQFADALLTNLPAILAALARAESAEREVERLRAVMIECAEMPGIDWLEGQLKLADTVNPGGDGAQEREKIRAANAAAAPGAARQEVGT